MFKHIDKSSGSKVKLGNREHVEIKGKWTIAINTSTKIKLISNVLFMPKIYQNLLSVGQLLEKKIVLLDSSGSELMTVEMKNRSFHWKLTSFVDESVLWHKRFGHFNYTSLRSLHEKDLANNMLATHYACYIYGVCQLDKLSRKPFPKV